METTKSTQSHTNVDYLLENFTVDEIIDIQNKLKLEVERKKQELKHLVGYYTPHHSNLIIHFFIDF